MIANDMLTERYPHLKFARQWGYDDELNYSLGQCDAMVEAISLAPLLPKFRQKLHLLSLRKGAQATTAI